MKGWIEHKGQIACLPQNNIDTDQLLPARFMSQPRAAGYAAFLFHDQRKLTNDEQDPTFVLNKYPNTSILIAGHNFGTGSSREAAVYALIDAGIQVVVASRFADIFAANAINNGLLPALVSGDALAILHSAIGNNSVSGSANLENCQLVLGDTQLSFSLDKNAQSKLINGWDDIDLTLHHQNAITAFKERRAGQHRWTKPVRIQPNE